jgi:hypothetical protein
MARQGAFTAVVPIDPERVESLRTLLVRIGATVDEPGCPVPFREIESVHFMRWVILDVTRDAAGKNIPPSLVLSTNYDEPLDDHLRELADVTGATFDQIYGHCAGYAPGTDRVAFLKAHRVRYAAFYVGTRGRGVRQVRQEQELRDAVEKYLDTTPGLPARPTELVARLQQTFTTGRYAWVRDEPAGKPPAGIPLDKVWKAALVLVVGSVTAVTALVLVLQGLRVPGWLVLVVILALLLVFVLFLLVLRSYETYERLPNVLPVGAPIAELTAREDQVVQNQLTNVVHIKPSLFRRVTVRLVLWAIDLLGRIVFVRGALGGIPSIHFARWVILPRGRLLFMSNFDGSWENYLGDFIDKAAVGLTGIWSNTIGCPPARFLVLGGARDEQRFKAWVRENQLVTQVWYSAYRDLSVENINNNTRIRLGLADPATAADEARARAWLALL